MPAVIAAIVGRKHPGDQQPAPAIRLKNAQETILAIVVDVSEILILHAGENLPFAFALTLPVSDL